MKGKKILALATIFAGTALVGSTFALWAVTDNASPFNVAVSPGTISSDTSTTPVTLSYGDRTFSNVGNIVNNTKRLAATVELDADWTINPNDATTATLTGQFSVELNQESTASVKLIDFLKVYVCDAAPTVADGVVTTLNGNVKCQTHVTDHMTSNATNVVLNKDSKGNTVKQTMYVIVEYLETTSANIDVLSNDTVTLTMDWGKTGSDVVEGKATIYYSGTSQHPAVYSWKADKSNFGSWPGVEMSKVRDGLYSYQLDASVAGFIITDHETEAKLTGENDIIYTEWAAANYHDNVANVCYYGNSNSWGTIPTLAYDYYLVGTFSSWDVKETYGLSATANTGVYELKNVSLAAGAELKVTDKTMANWFTDESDGALNGLATLVDGGNIKITNAGNYDITFYVVSDYNNHVVIANHA